MTIQEHVKTFLLESNHTHAEKIRSYLSNCEVTNSISHFRTLEEILNSEEKPDIIIAELELPDSNGLDTLQSIREKYSHSPIIVLTSLDSDDMALQAVQMGAHDYLHKKIISGQTLKRVLRYTLERSHLSRKLQNQEHSLIQSEKMSAIGTLAAGIAHEINTPIQYIGDNTRFLQDAFVDLGEIIKRYDCLLQEVLAGKVRRKTVDELQSGIKEFELEYLMGEIPSAIRQSLIGIDQVSKIILSMKAFSHPSSGDMQLHDLNKAIETTCTISRNEWKYVADIETKLAKDLDEIECFPGEINQVLLNIIVNAAHAIGDNKAGEEKGIIRIETKNTAKYAEIKISDNGGGIPKEIRHRVFDPFFTTKEPGKGTGQGLAIAYSIVEDRHKGTLKFRVEDGIGTTFTIQLPKKKEKPTKHEVAKNETQSLVRR